MAGRVSLNNCFGVSLLIDEDLDLDLNLDYAWTWYGQGPLSLIQAIKWQRLNLHGRQLLVLLLLFLGVAQR